MKRIVGVFVLGVCGIVFLANSSDSQETKAPKGKSPFGWGFLKLSAEQKAKIGRIQGDFKTKIQPLEEKIKSLKDEEHTEMLKVLTAEQKKQLQAKAGAELKSDDKK